MAHLQAPVLTLSILFLLGCSPKYRVPANQSEDADRHTTDRSGKRGPEYYAKDYLGNEYEVEWNGMKTHALAHKGVSVGRQGMEPTLHLLIYELAGDTVIFRDVVPAGRASWSKNGHLRVRSLPGIMRGNETTGRQNGYTYDVIQHQKRQLSNQP